MENSIKTYGPNPLETREIRSLPECDCFNYTVLDEKSCEVMYRIEALMERLAPMGIDNMRSLWIETVRGDIRMDIAFRRIPFAFSVGYYKTSFLRKKCDIAGVTCEKKRLSSS